jgi:mRNA-degrading endonuclease YafQ of YafQ-DinJ toxin-antitoxin module
MIITSTKSFEKSLKKSVDKESVKKAVVNLITAIESDVKPKGLGLKKLKGDIWEIRAGFKVRILFAMYPQEIRFLLAGSHNDIHSFLKRQ